MWIKRLALLMVAAFVLYTVMPASADTLRLKDGSTIEGVIKKVEAGIVYVTVNNEERNFDILTIVGMDFNTPHLLTDAANAPIDHFLKDIEAQEIVRNIEEIEKAASQIRKMLDQTRVYWAERQPVAHDELKGWEAAKAEFRKPLSRYQEVLNDLYFHVLAKVDEYNAMMKEARKAYVGVKGVRTGSHLVAKDMEYLPLRKYVPAAWHDTIFYDGYNLGYDDAYIKFAPKN